GGRHLDGPLLPPVVRRDGQGARALPLLQGRQPRPDGGGRAMSMPTIEVDIDRLIFELESLAMASSTEPPAVTRIVYSEPDRAAGTLIKQLGGRGGLEVREDPIGNLFARWEGNRPDLPAVATGSHIDAIPHSGQFDGTVGVLGAIEAILALKR